MEDVSAESVLVEVCNVHGRVLDRQRVTLSGEPRTFTVGRAVHANVTIDDDYAAPLHASVELTSEGKVLVSDLDSRNGIVVGGKRHRGARNLELADGFFKIGHTRVRVRTARESLAPEKPDQLEPASIVRNPAVIAVVAGLICAGQLAYGKWLGAPRDLAAEIVTELMLWVLVATGWIALWALISRMTQWMWRCSLHAAILLGVAAVFIALDGLLQLGSFILAVQQSDARIVWVGGIGVACALYLHLTRGVNVSARKALAAACIIPALFGGTGYWALQREVTRDVDHIGTKLRIYPPALRLRDGEPVEAFFQRSAVALRDRADRIRAALPDEEAPSTDGELSKN